jgi:hypothetical protein
MRPPIFADYKGDLCIFESVAAAERYIEPIDAQNQECAVFDADGRILAVFPDAPTTKIMAPEPPRFDADHLAECLRRFLAAVGHSATDLHMPLPRLVELARSHAER